LKHLDIINVKCGLGHDTAGDGENLCVELSK